MNRQQREDDRDERTESKATGNPLDLNTDVWRVHSQGRTHRDSVFLTDKRKGSGEGRISAQTAPAFHTYSI